jgi:hypothetical protein
MDFSPTPSLAQLGRPSRSPLPPLFSLPRPTRASALLVGPCASCGPASLRVACSASACPRPSAPAAPRQPSSPGSPRAQPPRSPPAPAPGPAARASRPCVHDLVEAAAAAAATAQLGPARQERPVHLLGTATHDFFARCAVFFAQVPSFSPSTAPPCLALALCVPCAVGVPPSSPRARSPHSLRSESRRRAAVETTSRCGRRRARHRDELTLFLSLPHSSPLDVLLARHG